MLVGAVLVLSLTFRAQLQPHTYPLYLFAIVVTAFLAGLRPALMATILSVIATNYVEYRQLGRLRIDINDAIQLAILVAIAVIITALVAQRQNAERALEAANRELRDLDRDKDRLIASISHELRTPATVILGWSEILKHDTSPEILRTALPSIESAGRAQSRLIEDLLDMSRLILGKLRLEMAATSLASVVRSAVEMAEPVAEERGIDLSVALPSDPCVVEGDAIRLQQICWNLLSNAVKFTSRGGTIVVSLRCQDRMTQFTVADTGEGIAPELLPHLFEPLRQGIGATEKGGLGLGLSIVQQLVTMHHGTIEAKSGGPGKGSQFTVTLPLSA